MFNEITSVLSIGLIIITNFVNIFMPFIMSVVSFISLMNSLDNKRFNKIKSKITNPFKDCIIVNAVSLILFIGVLFYNFIYNLCSAKETVRKNIDVFKNILINEDPVFTPYVYATISCLAFIILSIILFIVLVLKGKIVLSCKESVNKSFEDNISDEIKTENSSE